jgi:hypothetical protein
MSASLVVTIDPCSLIKYIMSASLKTYGDAIEVEALRGKAHTSVDSCKSGDNCSMTSKHKESCGRIAKSWDSSESELRWSWHVVVVVRISIWYIAWQGAQSRVTPRDPSDLLADFMACSFPATFTCREPHWLISPSCQRVDLTWFNNIDWLVTCLTLLTWGQLGSGQHSEGKCYVKPATTPAAELIRVSCSFK